MGRSHAGVKPRKPRASSAHGAWKTKTKQNKTPCALAHVHPALHLAHLRRPTASRTRCSGKTSARSSWRCTRATSPPYRRWARRSRTSRCGRVPRSTRALASSRASSTWRSCAPRPAPALLPPSLRSSLPVYAACCACSLGNTEFATFGAGFLSKMVVSWVVKSAIPYFHAHPTWSS